MPFREQHQSPDGSFRLLVIRDSDDITVGFDGYPWHTHGDVIAGELTLAGGPSTTPEDAVRRFVEDLIEGRIPLTVVRAGGEIRDVWASYLPESDDPGRPDDEELELRRWDGARWPVN